MVISWLLAIEFTIEEVARMHWSMLDLPLTLSLMELHLLSRAFTLNTSTCLINYLSVIPSPPKVWRKSFKENTRRFFTIDELKFLLKNLDEYLVHPAEKKFFILPINLFIWFFKIAPNGYSWCEINHQSKMYASVNSY